MSPLDVKKVVFEAIDALDKPHVYKRHPPRTEFSKKLLIGVLIFVGLFCGVSTVAWFLLDDWPQEIAEFFIWPIVAVVSYMLKSAYENKAKIQGGDKP